MSTKFFTNNEDNTVFQKFKGILENMKDIYAFHAVAGYFRSSGYFALQEYLKDIKDIKILVGINVDQMFADAQRKGLLYFGDEEKTKEEFLKWFIQDLQEAKYSEQVENGVLDFIQDLIDGRIEVRAFPIFQTLSGKSSISETPSHILSWSHYFEILKADSELEINFYIKQSSNENWSVRELKRQMKSMLFHRLALSKDKKGVIELSEKGIQTQKPEDIIKDPYVLEFLNIPQKEKYLEGELEDKIIENLQHFLLELGKGFAFIGRQYKMNIGSRHFYADLVFYHRILEMFCNYRFKKRRN